MKKIVIIICLFILVRPVVPVIRYAIDYDHVSKMLCINKQKPELGCNGKCYLMKQLARESESEKPLSRDKKCNVWEFELVWFCKTESIPDVLKFVKKIKPVQYHSALHPSDANSFVLKPPIF